MVGGCTSRVLRVALVGVCTLVGAVAAVPSPATAGVRLPYEPAPLDPPPVPPALPFDAQADARGRAEITTEAVLAPQPTTRAFGTEPYQDTTSAAAAEAAARRGAGCSLSNARLAVTMLAITFTEAGPLASTSVAPSPMTLSRWDTQAILYSFANQATAFPRAFWHPGIGLWQFDHPWANTATERIDTRSAADLAAEVVAGRWCAWTPTTGLTRFQYTVQPWHGCDDETGAGNRCLGIFNHHFRANDPARLDDDGIAAITLQPGVTRLGGARYTTCLLAGETSPRLCMFVDPATAQGSRAWAATSGLPTPLAAPFYVIRVGDREWRYWMRVDTGYDRDILATAVVGSNPRSTLTWQNGLGLCEVGPNKGTCSPLPACSGRCFHLTNSSTGGAANMTFWDDQPATQVLVGDWNGDGVDTFGFRVGSSYVLKNRLAPGPADVTFSYGLASDAVLVGDWNGDGRDTLGVRRGQTNYLKNSLSGGAADVTFGYGQASDVVLVGDWNGDGRDTLGVRRGQTNYLKNSLSGGAADVTFGYGQASDAVLVGDWNGDRRSTLAVRRGRTYYVRNFLSSGAADLTFIYGLVSDEAHVGDWNRDGRDTLGVRR
jgi:hypothetical protein